MFSKSCEYGLRAVLLIAQQSLNEKRISLVEIAEDIQSPIAFTAKILQQLSKAKVIDSTKGPYGGFSIKKESLQAITLSEIVTVIDGDDVYTGCGLGLKQCDESYPCPVHDKFKVVRDELKQMLVETNLMDLMDGLDNGLTYLKR